jgi:Zn-dependent peptidase ImmA (M78 family)
VMTKHAMPINPDVLRWAREIAGYSLEEISKKPSFSKFSQWEEGKSAPSYPQLEKIAETLHRPVALFFFPERPQEETIEKSLRAISEDDITSLKPTIRQLFRKAKAFQISLRELQTGEATNQSQRIAWLNSAGSGSIPQIAKKVRDTLGVSLTEQHAWKNSDVALKNWRSVLAAHGIYVFKEAFRNDRVAGFCIYDDLYPIIFINNSLEDNRQIFTLFHELAHILFKQSYLDIFDTNFWNLEFNDPSHIEVKCNAFAAEFLVPEQEFISDAKGVAISDATFRILADKYHVSREVILRRFLTHKYVDKAFYQTKVHEWYQGYATHKQKQKETKKKSGNYYNSKMAYLGDAYLGLVLQNYNQGKIDIEEASSHLDIKRRALPIIEEKFLSREVSNVRI